MPRPKAGILHKTCAHAECGQEFEVPDKLPYRNKIYCTKACSNRATAAQRAESVRAAKRYQPPLCPCGNEVPPPPGQQYIYKEQKKYCSETCRKLYGGKRQPDPANHVTFNCLNCGKEVTRYKNYGKGHNKYCSNKCAATHTKTRRFYAVGDFDIVFESSYECLFWSLCMFAKLPVERADRSQAVQFGEDGWYCPDFWLPTLGLFIETKGYEDDDDRARYAAWRETGRPLLVLGLWGLSKVLADFPLSPLSEVLCTLV
jgi:hypothetical protein